jgi:hypothetical protein
MFALLGRESNLFYLVGIGYSNYPMPMVSDLTNILWPGHSFFRHVAFEPCCACGLVAIPAFS